MAPVVQPGQCDSMTGARVRLRYCHSRSCFFILIFISAKILKFPDQPGEQADKVRFGFGGGFEDVG
jgi:hypothetical protein